MKGPELRFTGSVAEKYEQLMTPLLFRPFALELAGRACAFQPKRILETAAGTGAVTRALHELLPDGEIIATDINQPMLDVAARSPAMAGVQFVNADAQQLPFGEESFDLVLCQFGSMFFPDRVKGHSEARRVLKPGGCYLLGIWDRIERNALCAATQETLVELFPNDPPMFMRDGPFGYHDPLEIEADLRKAGFAEVELETIELRSRSPSAREAAIALCYGTPVRVEVEERQAGSLDAVFACLEKAMRRFERDSGVDAPMSAHIVTATR